MIATWAAWLNKEEQEAMAEEEERIRKLEAQGAFDYDYSDKMNQQMLREMGQIDNSQYAKVLDNIKINEGYVQPGDLVAKIRAENPKLAGQPIPPPNGEQEKVDMSGKYSYTIGDFINGTYEQTAKAFPIKGHPLAKKRLLNYPEFWIPFKLVYSQWIVPISKYAESCNWTLKVNSTIRGKESVDKWQPWLSYERFTISDPDGRSDHRKGCAFDLQAYDNKGKLPMKVVQAILYKKLLLQQVPNTPNNKFARQILIEHMSTSTAFSDSGWVHIAGKRFENDASPYNQFGIMRQNGNTQDMQFYLSPAAGVSNGTLANQADVMKVSGEFQKGLTSFFTAGTISSWNSAPSDKQWWMSEVRMT